MQYQTVQDVSRGSPITITWGGSCKDGTTYTYQPPNPPSGETRSFEPYTLVETRPEPNNDKSSFKKIRQSGVIKMTNYSIGKVETRHSLVRVPRMAATLGWPSCNDLSWVGNQVKVLTTWEEQGDLIYWSLRYPSYADRSVLDTASAIESVKAAVVAANLNTYDLLTELGEAKETLAAVVGILRTVRRPLEAYKAFVRSLKKRNDLSPEKISEMLQSKWMELRYSIMPAFYSIQDVSKLISERNAVYKTDRAKRSLKYDDVSDVPLLNTEKSYIYQEVSGSVTIRAVGKARYNVSNLNLRLFDQIGLNPFVTAWELIPFSFVVDWFINVGDWVQAQTSSLVDVAEQRCFCYSVKQDLKVLTKLRVVEVERFTKSYPALNGSVVHEHHIDVDGVLATETINTYSRHIFNASDTELTSDVSMNWKRWIDAFVLSNKPLFKALRSLR